MGALPARFRKERVLIIGCGDVGQRAAKQWVGRVKVAALTSSPEKCADLRAKGIVPLLGNLDTPDTGYTGFAFGATPYRPCRDLVA
ncbi:MAG: hypothetical protein RIS02_2123 [Pseudomonadota bacterium]